MKYQLKFLAGVVKDRFTDASDQEKALINKTLSESVSILEDTLSIKTERKPEIFLENRRLRHYAKTLNGSTECGGHFDFNNPTRIFLVRGENPARSIPHELMHYTIYHMNWNPQHKDVNEIIMKKMWFNQFVQWRMALIGIMEECSCYIFDAIYTEKTTGKKFVNMADGNFANSDKFAEKFYQALKMQFVDLTIINLVFKLERKYKNAGSVEFTVYLRLLNAINLLILTHHNWDLKSALQDTLEMQQKGFEYALYKLGTYVPADFATPTNALDLLSSDD